MYRSFEGSIYTRPTPVPCTYLLRSVAPPVLYILPPNFLYSPPTSVLYHFGSILSSSFNSERTVVRIVRLRIGVRPAIFEVNQRLLE